MPKFSTIQSAEDFRREAARRLPKPVFDFIDGGAEDEVAVRYNRAAFERVRFRPRTVVDVTKRSLEVDLFGKRMAAPIGIAPMGGLSNFAPGAEIAMARACAAAGVPYGVSTVAAVSLDRLREVVPDARLWFQLYVFNDERLNRALVERAQRAGYEALLVTTDTHMPPKRERDLRNGFSLTVKKTPANIAHVLSRPRWLWDVYYKQGLPRMDIIEAEVPEVRSHIDGVKFFQANRRASFDYGHIRELRRLWKGPLLLKGVMRPDEAEQALAAGADGIVMSNHGGRNLDHAAAPFEMLPEVADAVGKRMTILIDSGFRRGTDIAKAIALGAHGVLFGRPAAFAVAAGGEAGVGHFLGLMKDELDRVLGYLGVNSPDQLGRDYLLIDRLPPGHNAPGI